jgi:hypothetical protein
MRGARGAALQIAILDTGGEAEVRWCAFKRETRQEALACTGGNTEMECV